MPDVLTVKKNALRKMDHMLEGPYLGGQEEKLIAKEVLNNHEKDAKNVNYFTVILQ